MKMERVRVIREHNRIIHIILVGIGYFFVSLFFFWWFSLDKIPHNFSGYFHGIDYLLFIILSFIVWQQIVKELFLWWVSHDMKLAVEMNPEPNKKVAFLTAFVPGKESYDVLEKTLQAMVAVEYPHDSWVLDEGNDIHTMKLCALYGVKHFSRYGIPKFNMEEGKFKARTKAGNYNSWFYQHGRMYDYVAQLDVDFVPQKTFLLETLGYFCDPSVGFVGTPQIYGNESESWIAKGASEQAYGFYGNLQRGLFGKDMSLFIGANHVVRVDAFFDIGGYAGHIVEDHLTGMKFYARKWKSVYVCKNLAEGEGPATWDAYFSQQMRWAYGLMHIFFNESKKLLPKMRFKHAIRYFILQHHYFDGIAQILSIILLMLYFIFGLEVTRMSLFYLLALYLPIIIWQQVISFWLQRFNVNCRKERGVLLKGRLVSIASWPIYFMAFMQVIMKKKLTYKVTPKGQNELTTSNLQLFIPHFVIGSITLVGVVISFFTHHQAIHLIIIALLNTACMYLFVILEAQKNFIPRLREDLRFFFKFHPLLHKLRF